MSTPTPWTQDGAYVVATVDGRHVDVADCARPLNSSIALGRENAALIARAVNCHSDLLEALKDLARAYVNTLESGRDRIMSLGGDCDPVDVMERANPWLNAAKAAIAKAEAQP